MLSVATLFMFHVMLCIVFSAPHVAIHSTPHFLIHQYQSLCPSPLERQQARKKEKEGYDVSKSNTSSLRRNDDITQDDHINVQAVIVYTSGTQSVVELKVDHNASALYELSPNSIKHQVRKRDSDTYVACIATCSLITQ